MASRSNISAGRTLGPWGRIPIGALLCVCVPPSAFVLSCVGRGLTTGWCPSSHTGSRVKDPHWSVVLCNKLVGWIISYDDSYPHFQSGLLGFWTVSIVRYSKEHNVSGTGSVSVLGWGRALLGPLERANLNHWWTMDKVQKPSNPERCTPLSEPFRNHVFSVMKRIKRKLSIRRLD
jgi:hypothetical protein